MKEKINSKKVLGSGWGTHVYLWRIHFDIWQNQYNIVKFKNKIKLKKKKKVNGFLTSYSQQQQQKKQLFNFLFYHLHWNFQDNL